MSVPNVNLFIGYVDCLKGKNSQDEYVKENFEARRFYSAGKDYDYVKYVQNGSKEKLDFVDYSGNEEKSKGIFDENGLMNEQQIKELRTKLRDTSSPIWHGVISFTEEFGDQFCDNYEKAYNLMKTQLPKFFENAGFYPDNMVWFAGLHVNTDNKHIHFSFFEKAPLRTKQKHKGVFFSEGLINKTALRSFKVDIELHLLNIYQEIGKNRKALTNSMKEGLNLGVFMKNIKSLVFILPEKGRLSYESENIKPFKPQIDLIVNSIINSNKDLKAKFDNFDKILSIRDNELLKAYSKLKINYTDKLLHDKCIYDIYRRLGNLVLYTVKQIRIEQMRLDYETKNRLVRKRIDKIKRKALIKKCMQLSDLVNREIISAFQEYLDKLEEANFKIMKEEGLLD